MIIKTKRSAIGQLFVRKRWRWVQMITRIRRIHHPRWSFGWALPFGWVYFEKQIYKDDLDRDKIKIRPAHWERCHRDSYHDCTTSGVY